MDSGAGGQRDGGGTSRGWPATSYQEWRDRQRPKVSRSGPPRGPGLDDATRWRWITVGLAGLVGVGLLVVACGILPGTSGPGATGSPSGGSPGASGSGLAGASSTPDTSASGSPDASAEPSASQNPSASPASGTVPLAVVSGFDNYKVTAVTKANLKSRLEGGTLILPCGAETAVAHALGSSGKGAAACVAADKITATLGPGSTRLALVPPALVTPRVKVVPLEGADLFGEKPARAKTYPLAVAPPASWPAAWTRFAVKDVRVVVTTGVTCPDRGVSHQTVVLKKGWNWLLQAGTARYRGTHYDTRYGWTVVEPVRSGHAGSLLSLLKNADVTVSDFECPMTRHFVQHDSGTAFSIDPRVAKMMASAGFDVATIGADHTTNAGLAAVGETVDAFKASHIQPTGAGRTLAEALKPAVVNAGGIKFGFVGFDAIGGSTYATTTTAGVARLTLANAKAAIARAKAAGAQVIIALPQWSSREYHAGFDTFQKQLTTLLVSAGADHIVGADFHWAGGLAISRTGSTYRYVGASQGNFWFGQDWSRQTQEGIITSLTFAGTKLMQVRLTPTVVVDNAQVNLTAPATDGQFVLKQVLSVSTLPSK